MSGGHVSVGGRTRGVDFVRSDAEPVGHFWQSSFCGADHGLGLASGSALVAARGPDALVSAVEPSIAVFAGGLADGWAEYGKRDLRRAHLGRSGPVDSPFPP